MQFMRLSMCGRNGELEEEYLYRSKVLYRTKDGLKATTDAIDNGIQTVAGWLS